jgi:indole-3-glycerol phosphate synthase
VRIIAEVKKASPSAGVLREDFDPVAIARIYEAHGAACISVLTDAPYFQGSLAYLSAIRESVALPLLRKDFLLDPYQVLEARVAGADAVLLIAEILDDATLSCLLRETHMLGMHALVEFYDAANLPRVLKALPRIVGVNNRNLRSFEMQPDRALTLAKRIPSGILMVAESGIKQRPDIEQLRKAGIRAALIGSTLMRAADIGQKLDELRGVGARTI